MQLSLRDSVPYRKTKTQDFILGYLQLSLRDSVLSLSESAAAITPPRRETVCLWTAFTLRC
jgi:hypothetical protein